MVSQDQEQELRDAWNFVRLFERRGRTRRQFWALFEERFGSLGKRAWAEDGDPGLLQRYLQVVGLADDRGMMGPDDTLDEVMFS